MKNEQCKNLVDTVMYAEGNYMGSWENPAADLINFLREETPERRQVMYEFIHCLYVMVGEVGESKHCPHCGSSSKLLVPCDKCGKLLLPNNPDSWFRTCDPANEIV